jgi:molecular chaperone Hsp33
VKPETQDNLIRPFHLQTPDLRGRAVRVGAVLDDILSRHAYPDAVAQLTGEMVVLALLLSSMLKYDGVFTLQMQGDGAVKMAVADVRSPATVRACASFDSDRLARFGTLSPDMGLLLGKGHIAFTVDQGENTERYQGIVELKGASLVDCVQHYFTQSEQIATGIRLAVGKVDGKWRGGAVMVQHLPEQAGVKIKTEGEQDDWRRVMMLMHTCTDAELLDDDLSADDLLVRLFHEEGLAAFPAQDVSFGCRCSAARAENILLSLAPEEVDEMAVDGKLEAKCEFCSRAFTFDSADIRAKKLK